MKSVLSPPDAELASRIRLVVYRMRRRLHREQAGDLTPSQASALSSVERLGPLTLGELSTAENVKPPTMTKVVAALEERGLVTRHVDPSDRRVCRVQATVEGTRLLNENRSRTDAYLARRLSSLPAAERAALERAVGVLERMIEEEEG